MKAIKSVVLSFLLLSLSACSALDTIGSAAGVLSDKPSIDATAQVGKENRQEGDAVIDTRRVEERQEDRRVDAVVKDQGVSNVTQTETRKEAGDTSGVSLSELSGDIQALNVNNVPPLFLFLFALGWVLPGPVEIVKGVGKILMFLRNLIIGR